MNSSDQYRAPLTLRVLSGDAVGGYDWTEVFWDESSDDYVAPDSPRSGTNSLFERNGGSLIPGRVVDARFRAWDAEADAPTYEASSGGSDMAVANVTGVAAGNFWPAVLVEETADGVWTTRPDPLIYVKVLDGSDLLPGEKHLVRRAAYDSGGRPVWHTPSNCCPADEECPCVDTPATVPVCVTATGVHFIDPPEGDLALYDIASLTFSATASRFPGRTCAYGFGASRILERVVHGVLVEGLAEIHGSLWYEGGAWRWFALFTVNWGGSLHTEVGIDETFGTSLTADCDPFCHSRSVSDLATDSYLYSPPTWHGVIDSLVITYGDCALPCVEESSGSSGLPGTYPSACPDSPAFCLDTGGATHTLAAAGPDGTYFPEAEVSAGWALSFPDDGPPIVVFNDGASWAYYTLNGDFDCETGGAFVFTGGSSLDFPESVTLSAGACP